MFLLPTVVSGKTNTTVSNFNNCFALVKEIYPEIKTTSQLKFIKKEPTTGSVVKFRGSKVPQHFALVLAIEDGYMTLEEFNYPYGKHTIGRKVSLKNKSIVGFWTPDSQYE